FPYTTLFRSNRNRSVAVYLTAIRLVIRLLLHGVAVRLGLAISVKNGEARSVMGHIDREPSWYAAVKTKRVFFRVDYIGAVRAVKERKYRIGARLSAGRNIGIQLHMQREVIQVHEIRGFEPDRL